MFAKLSMELESLEKLKKVKSIQFMVAVEKLLRQIHIIVKIGLSFHALECRPNVSVL